MTLPKSPVLHYGLAQWTYWSRKQNLLDYAKGKGKSVGDLETQLEFLLKELTSYGLLNTLKTASSVKAASDVILLQFEKPADQSEAVKTRRAGYGQVYYDKYAAKTTTGGTTVAKKITTGKELAEAALNVAKNFKTLYVMGCFGAPMTAANKTRYINNGACNSYNAQASRRALIDAASADTFGFDCVCFIKGLLWGWSGDASQVYGGAGYAVNGVPDIGEDAMIAKCSGVSTDFSRIEVGEAVWMPGHIGIYIGDGLAVECTPSWKNCVQVTACNCAKSGYNRRNWTKHGKLPYVSYTGAADATAAVAKLARLGVINAPDYWDSLAASGAVQYLDQLLIKAADKITKAGPRSSTPENGVGSLVAAGVINTPDYWLETYHNVANLGALLCALGGSVKK